MVVGVVVCLQDFFLQKMLSMTRSGGAQNLLKGLTAARVEGEAGAGLVKVVASGAGSLVSVRIDPSILSKPPAVLEDLVVRVRVGVQWPFVQSVDV